MDTDQFPASVLNQYYMYKPADNIGNIHIMRDPGIIMHGDARRGTMISEGSISDGQQIYPISINNIWSYIPNIPHVFHYMHSFKWVSDLSMLSNNTKIWDFCLNNTLEWLSLYSRNNLQNSNARTTAHRIFFWIYMWHRLLSYVPGYGNSGAIRNDSRKSLEAEMISYIICSATEANRWLHKGENANDKITVCSRIIFALLSLGENCMSLTSCNYNSTYLRQLTQDLLNTLEELIRHRSWLETFETPTRFFEMIQGLVFLTKILSYNCEVIPNFLDIAIAKGISCLRKLQRSDGSIIEECHPYTTSRYCINYVMCSARTTSAQQSSSYLPTSFEENQNATSQGYLQITARRSVLLVDTMSSPYDAQSTTTSYAGSLDFSYARRQIIVHSNRNCPTDSPTKAYGIYNKNPLSTGKATTTINRGSDTNDKWCHITNMQNKNMKIWQSHSRKISLSLCGNVLAGEETFKCFADKKLCGTLTGVRFLLHPDVNAYTSDNSGATDVFLAIPNGHVWVMSQIGGRRISLERTAFHRADYILVNSTIIVIYGDTSTEETQIRWTLRNSSLEVNMDNRYDIDALLVER